MAAFTGDPGITDVFAAAAVVINYVILDEIHGHNVSYYEMYRDQREFYFQEFVTGGEVPFVNEVFAEPVYTPQYLAASDSIRNDMLLFPGGFENWYARKTKMYHMQGFLDVDSHTPQALDRRAHEDDMLNYVYAREEHLTDVYNVRRISRQLDSMNVGIKQGSYIERGLASSFAVLDDAYGNSASFFATQANGLARFSGYTRERDDTKMAQVAYRAGQSPIISNDISGYGAGRAIFGNAPTVDSRLS